ncbi:hypothetical protein chiPu_0014352 [Chiloscyllium punctatum]|uniref:Uncharacterized protein n=1 Tax=Chiloscyllium punctatum TaxID=137246 RepID=A0A401SZN6_CHIPU|nr:hypothetical protein [Chiloscyllium punctatum]
MLGNATHTALKVITQNLNQLRLLSMQNHYALDYLLARQGGVYPIAQDKCIMDLDNVTANVTRYVHKIDEQLGSIKEGKRWAGRGDWELGGRKDWLVNMAI